jgi:hypothetical protein
MPPVAREQDISATTDCGSKNRLVFGRKGGLRAGSDSRGDFEKIAEGFESLDPLRLLGGQISCGFLEPPWMGSQNRMILKVLQ